MTNELTTQNESLIPQDLSVSKYAQEEGALDTVVKATSSWLPRLSLNQATSEAVKQGKTSAQHWTICKRADSVDNDLGITFEAIVVSVRPKAMVMPDEGGAPLNYYNPKTPEFQAAQAKADKDGFDGGCSYGPEFLIYVPSEQKFCTYFMAGITAKNAFVDLRARMGKGATFTSTFIKKGKYSWYGPIFTKSSSPLAAPDAGELKTICDVFNNPEDSQVELDPESVETKAR